MELDNFLHKVQGVLKNEQRIIGSLSTIKKENEPNISKIVDSLKKIAEEAEFNCKTKQKLYILLFLNTDSDTYNNLKKNRKCAHLVGFLPKLSRELFMKIVVGLQLYQYLYESVQNFAPSLSHQVLEMSIKTLSWLDLFEAVGFVENLLVSLFRKIFTMSQEDKDHTSLKETFQTLLLHYDAEKGGNIKRMSQWNSSKLKHYGGLVMTSMLSLLEKCTNIYCKKENNKDAVDHVLYNIHSDEETVQAGTLKENEIAHITVQNCYEHVVAKCLENVCSITVDLWLFWVEIDLDDIPDTENTLQRQIGERAYTCRETLLGAQCLGVASKEISELISRLNNIALKPNPEDQSRSLDLGEVLKNIQDPDKDTIKWIKFLLNNPLFVIEHDSLTVLKRYVDRLQTSDVLLLVKHIFQHIKTTANCQIQKDFILEIVKSLLFDAQLELARCFIENFGLSEILKKEQFQEVFIETFNKVISEDEETYCLFLSLALQSPEAVVNRAVTEGITSEVRGHLMADILGRLQPFCDATKDLNPLLVVALDNLLLSLPDLPENQHKNYPLFVRELVMRQNLNGEQFIKGCLMSKMHLHLKTKNYIVISACLETLSELYDIDCVDNHPACLVMLMQVVEANRWSPQTFNMAAVRVCELAMQLVDEYITKWFEVGYEERQRKNLATLVERCISPLNRYHLSRLLADEQLPSDLALQLIFRMHYGIGEWSVVQVTEEDRLKLVYALCYVLPVLTSKEWQDLFCVAAPKCSEFMCLFHMVTDSILLCLNATKANPDQIVLNCLNYAIVNVAQVIKYEVNRWNVNDNEYRISVLSKICQLVSSLPLAQQETFGLTLMKVLQQLLPKGSRRRPLTDEETTSATASIASIQAGSLRQNLAKEFLEMINL